jgi:hypothetical protein
MIGARWVEIDCDWCGAATSSCRSGLNATLSTKRSLRPEPSAYGDRREMCACQHYNRNLTQKQYQGAAKTWRLELLVMLSTKRSLNPVIPPPAATSKLHLCKWWACPDRMKSDNSVDVQAAAAGLG